MKKLILLITAVLLICLSLTSCGTYLPDYVTFWREISPKDTIEQNEDDSITYKETKYVRANNSDGKISADYKSEHCIKIATMPYSYILGAVSLFYADDFENPDIIFCNRGHFLWVREGMDIDEVIMNNNCIVNDSFAFRICDVITDEFIPYSYDLEDGRSLTKELYAMPLEDYPAFSFDISIKQIDGELYLQYVWDSDFYKITDEFESDLYANGFID